MTESTGGGQRPVADAAPVLFPPPNPKSEQYALAPNSIRFGWDSAAAAGEGRFLVSKYRWTGGTAVVAEWPLSAEGWEAAWRYLLTEQPQLATAVQTVWTRGAQARSAAERRAQNQAQLDAEGRLDLLTECVYLGGYGVESGLAPADRVDLYFTQHGVWLTKTGGFKPYLRVPYAESRTLEFEGGTVRTGGGFMGGGFGALGAAEGMAIASLLNSLTSKTSVHTTIRFEAERAEIFLFTDRALPRNLEVRLAEVRARVRDASGSRSTSPPVSSGADLVEQLGRLSEMLDKGHLSPDEFAAAKARLLANPS
jgi:hypothetical protein